MGALSPLFENILSPNLFLPLVISLALVPLLRRFALKIKLVDNPGGRKQHKAPVPIIGGVAIYLASAIALVSWGVPPEYFGFAVCASGLFLIGLLDDKYDISAVFRLFFQTALVCFALYQDNVWLNVIPLTESYTFELGWVKYPLTTIIILGLINAINMLDGLDGLSSGIVLIILGFILGISSTAGIADISLITATVIGSVLGFWAFNYRFQWREKASVFMGDAGTTMLGFILPYLAIKLSIAAPVHAPKSMLLWLFAIPIWDIVAVIIKRMRDGKSPLQAGRDHVHHVLMNAGLTVRHTIHLIYLLTLTTISFGVAVQFFALSQLEAYLAFAMFMTVYLGRVGSLNRRAQKEIYDLKVESEKSINSQVIDISKRTKTLS
ncbi:glycosyltransferase family 4 protein [Aliikangiella sp. IMCC44632]